MFVAKPATAGADVFDRLHMFMHRTPTPFDLKRLERDAEQLENASLSEAYTVRAAIAALKWDCANASFWSEKACLVGAGTTPRMNASISFRYLNEVDLAVEYARQAHAIAPIDREIVNHLIGVLSTAGRFTEAAEVIKEYYARVPQAEPIEAKPTIFLTELASVGVSEERLRAELLMSMRVLSAERIRHGMLEFESDEEPDGAKYVVVKIRFRGDLSAEMRLEAKLAHLLAESPDWDPSKLSVEFEYEMEPDYAGEPA